MTSYIRYLCVLRIVAALAVRIAPPAANHVEEQRLAVSKMAWLHIPKTGTSFVNTLASFACPALPDSCQVNPPLHSFWETPERNCEPNKYCDPHFKICTKKSVHEPLGKGCNDITDGQFVTLLRQPEQRIISGYHHGLHDFHGQTEYGSHVENKPVSIDEYARGVAGCAVRMMIGRTCGARNGNFGSVTTSHVERAIDNLENRFAFVGLSDEWELSVCLFHKMHGGTCHPREFSNVRPGSHHSVQPYDATVLGNFTDEMDGMLYAHAKKMFWDRVKKYDVSMGSCREFCKPVAQFFQEDEGVRFAFDVE